MCAISGILSFDRNNYNGLLVQEMNQTMTFRGPDHQDVFQEGWVTLGHTRLSILDLSTGDQPMTSVDGKVTIVFNGEIYNFLDVKDECLKLGYKFNTTSDTEVIIAGYQLWGIEGVLTRLEGMFAFCIYDRSKNLIFIARDRFGEKPLYYQKENGKFTFASELKAFRPNLKKYSLDKEAMNMFFALSYIPAPYCIYQEIRKLEAGHYMQIDSDINVEDRCYYNLADRIKEPITDSYEEAKKHIRDLVYDSVRMRMIADVPTGSFLSGGIDSSIVSTVMAELSKEPIQTFSIGFKEKDFDESERAQLVADRIKSKHKLHYLDFNDVVDCLSEIVDYYDEPFSDSSAIPSYYVAKLAHEKVKVVLTGDSADEIFAGYNKYVGRYYANKFRNLPSIVKKAVIFFKDHCPVNQHTNILIRKLRKLIATAESSDFEIYYNLMCMGFSDDKRLKLLKGDFFDVKALIKKTYDECPSEELLNKEQYCDVKYVLEGQMFTKVDRACLHNSLENRTPILDTRIVEYSLRMNPEYRLLVTNKKRIFKDAFKDMLPDDATKFSKKGFGVPVGYWLRNELKSELDSYIDKSFIEQQGLFNYDFLKEIYDKHMSGAEYNDATLWNLFVFQRWYNKNIS